MPRGQYRSIERRLIREYLGAHREPGRTYYNARLGPIPPAAHAAYGYDAPGRLLSVTQMYADALIIEDHEVQIWEAKALLGGAAVGQLLEYETAWAATPDYGDATKLPVTLHLLASYARPSALAVARAQGIDVHLYTPEWIKEIAATWFGAQARPLVGTGYTIEQSTDPTLGR